MLTTPYQLRSWDYIWPFEGNLEADVAAGENEFDTPGLDARRKWYIFRMLKDNCPSLELRENKGVFRWRRVIVAGKPPLKDWVKEVLLTETVIEEGSELQRGSLQW